ncbi:MULTISPECIES: hypothetical protein [Alcaligenes]|jgi:hypothetical protein|uniref:Uncharacterized protein n=2 Tax=Alcaligenes TaxID=507 RepID=A0AB33CXN5_ALCFA|nr:MULTISPECIES: hypothetical protein [Alcaligenes]ASR91156.1 hypothetical protein AFA_17805 [Alcaligenes faecalis]AWG36179.1 hypothetical protein CA948_14150 [Alcaligenes aquatilis]MCC9164820.1 hypothetical protein [Alcaligenes sp. MMA]MCH4224839.1 hypothetical protein [Alcaligenes faecalis]QXR35843.1 hypothetical protein EGK70_018870 [Alcaligenes aquatilis]
MKTPVELRYLQRPVGEQLLPHLAQRKHLRRRIPLINLPSLTELFGSRKKREPEVAQDQLPHSA